MSTEQIFGGRLTMRHLVLLTTIADEGSFVGAAQALYSSQPAVTRSVREVESLVGVELFSRGPRGVTPTQFGEILIDHARSALGNLRRAAEEIREIRRSGVRPVRVGTNLAGAHSLLPRAVVALKQARPEITVSVVEGTAEQLSTSLLRSDLDLFVGRLDPGTYRGALHHIRLYDEAVRLVVRRGHPALEAQAPELADLLDYPWILPLRPSQLRMEIDEVFADQGLPLPVNVVECSTLLTLQPILLATDAIAPLPKLVALRDERLALLPANIDTVPRAIGVTLPADRSVGVHTRRFVDILGEVAQTLTEALTASASEPAQTPSPWTFA
ncbi:LysR family transcriptional regulator [Nocardioides sp. GXZ039]|uniref:LysR family transcriptional regulator n=1 Tax=Nocardioides sp. GXZ039 TaxID=3136018 RepID=UPI0030F42AE9